MNILLIRLREIGDVVFTTPMPRALKRAFPGARIAYAVESHAAPVVAGNPDVDDVIVLPRVRGWKRIAADLRLAARLRRSHFDLVIDFHGGPRAAWLALATGAPQRIGYRIPGRSWMYTTCVPRPRALRPRHSVVNQWDLLAAIDGWPSGAAEPGRDHVTMAADPAATAAIARRLGAAGVGPGHELIVAHVSAGNPFRRWPEEAFARCVATLAAASPLRRVILSSGPSDAEAARRIADSARRLLGADRARIVEFGDFNLAELRALVAASRLFIGGDTGPMHIAATTATPIVGVYGPTLPARSTPWRHPSATISLEVQGLPCRPCDQRVCAPGDFRCLGRISPEEVIAAAEDLLNGTP